MDVTTDRFAVVEMDIELVVWKAAWMDFLAVGRMVLSQAGGMAMKMDAWMVAH